jgi:hypothetical protein
MAVQPMTNEFMRLLPAALRPNPWNIDDVMMGLASNGWVVRDVFAATMANKPMEPGHVVAQLRRMLEQPAPARSDEWKFGHEKCNNPMHGPSCEICRCTKGTVKHHVPVPASPEIKLMLRQAMSNMEVPEW